jgi:hypothetical protein
VNTLASFHFGKERFRRNDPLKVVSTHYNNHKYRWSYASDVWEEEEIHCRERTYLGCNFKKRKELST